MFLILILNQRKKIETLYTKARKNIWIDYSLIVKTV
jgi:hypothetical protein